VDDAVAVALIGAARRALRLGVEPAAGGEWIGGPDGARGHGVCDTTRMIALQSRRQTAYVDGMNTPSFRVTARAATRIAEIAEANGGGALRVAVLAGGCSGFQYKFDLDRERAEDDAVIEQGPAVVFIDPASLDLLAGSELDYNDTLMGAHFAVRNPQATASCGCGTSFAID